MHTRKIFGPPGSGKTTYLLNLVQQELDSGISSCNIGYFAFTRKAANEAKERAIQRFPNLREDLDFPWFRTLHSLAFKCLGISSKDMMRPENYKEFAFQAGIDLFAETGEEDFIIRVDNPILNEINIARAKGLDLKHHYNQSGMEIEWYHFEYVDRAYRHYKSASGLMDFTDLLEKVLENSHKLPSLEVLIIDEAQDLSPLQWKLVKELIGKSGRAFIAGDDDQAVYTWAGADVSAFLDLSGDVVVLKQSYRVPAKIHHLANKVVKRIRQRQPKIWNPREEEGEVYTYNNYSDVDVTHGEWLILAPTNYMLNNMYEWLKSQGILFERQGHRSIPESVITAVMGWETLRKGRPIRGSMARTVYKYLGRDFVMRGHKTLSAIDDDGLYDIERLKEHHGLLTDKIWHEVLTKIDENKRSYLIALLRRGTKITEKATVRLSTIHGAKGGEADNVLLITDLSSKFSDDYYRNPDDLHRLTYVGVTRAKKSLHIILPKNEIKSLRI